VTLDALLGWTGVLLLVGGCALATIGLVGLIQKADIYEQLHVAGLVTGPGVVLVLLASVGTLSAETVTSAILVIAFVLVTGSISTHVIAHAAVRRYRPASDEAAGTAESAALTPAFMRDRVATAGTVRTERRPGVTMRIVIAQDGSAAARVGSDLASTIDWPTGTLIRVVSAQEGDRTTSVDAAADDPQAELERVASSLRRQGVDVETVVVRGNPADAVVYETATFGADLLITGSRRRGFVRSLFGVSAAGEIVDRAPCPVLVARTTVLRSLILTTDGSRHSDMAAELVASWPVFDLTRIFVVTVTARQARSADAVSQRTVDATAARLMDVGRDVVVEILHGNPAAAIVEAAQRHDADLIVIGSRGRTGLGRTILGSVAGDVVASAPCSVLIVAPPLRRPQAVS
jgi:monovalent cation/proton antiporter MnhG/PhaG subunit